MNVLNDDEYWMRQALQLAQQAYQQGEVPVGALLVHDDLCLAQGWNQPITHCDPTAHAEIIVLRQAALQSRNYRLLNTTLYVTLEPCTMCAGAIIQARVRRVVFGGYDHKAGAAGSRFDILRDIRHNHHVECVGGILAEECTKILKAFFGQRRESVGQTDRLINDIPNVERDSCEKVRQT